MIPILEEAGVAVAPLDALPTIKDYIKLVWGHFTGEENFKVDFSKGSVCCQPTGWRSGGMSPCQRGAMVFSCKYCLHQSEKAMN
jgi:hypothetical protein